MLWCWSPWLHGSDGHLGGIVDVETISMIQQHRGRWKRFVLTANLHGNTLSSAAYKIARPSTLRQISSSLAANNRQTPTSDRTTWITPRKAATSPPSPWTPAPKHRPPTSKRASLITELEHFRFKLIEINFKFCNFWIWRVVGPLAAVFIESDSIWSAWLQQGANYGKTEESFEDFDAKEVVGSQTAGSGHDSGKGADHRSDKWARRAAVFNFDIITSMSLIQWFCCRHVHRFTLLSVCRWCVVDQTPQKLRIQNVSFGHFLLSLDIWSFAFVEFYSNYVLIEIFKMENGRRRISWNIGRLAMSNAQPAINPVSHWNSTKRTPSGDFSGRKCVTTSST